MNNFRFPSPPEHMDAELLREQVRIFLSHELVGVPAERLAQSWSGYDPEFSRKLGRRGWLGMTWPKKYGGHERSAAERYVVMEELLAAGAPVGSHWIAERQSGPLLLKFGTEAQRMEVLPRIAAGECQICIGMSEPDAGSDLAAVRTRAERSEDGWRVHGTKLWTTNAAACDYMVLFCRTSGTSEDRRSGTSQLLVDLNLPGISISPITDISGAAHFNEVVFEDAAVPADALIGKEGQGWRQVMSELAYERSGPERFLSSFVHLVELVRLLRGRDDAAARRAVGRLVAHIIVLRRLSLGVTAMLDEGDDPQLQASLVKDLGSLLEQEIPEIAQSLIDCEPALGGAPFPAVLAHGILNAPSFSLRGGTREVLRGIIARGLGLR
ncbi:acyl-CoA dehydrogenase family protein [Novosphingopyxis sp.]|uniref:acyl-CoA dehydrogenase family protein n=1 Tax=Novosphingopyxis sp. TaxID=2709690 RepID=UPI003B5CD2DF